MKKWTINLCGVVLSAISALGCSGSTNEQLTTAEEIIDSSVELPVASDSLPFTGSTINAQNYEVVLSEVFQIMNRDFIGIINSRIANDFGSSQPGFDLLEDHVEITRVDEEGFYSCVLGGSLNQSPSAAPQLGSIALSECVVGDHIYSGSKQWNTSGISGRRISYDNLIAANHDGLSGFSISGSEQTEYTLVGGFERYSFSHAEAKNATGNGFRIEHYGYNSESRSDASVLTVPGGDLVHSLHELRDGSQLDLGYDAEDRSLSSNFTFRSTLFNDQEVTFSLNFEREYGYYFDLATREAVVGIEIRPVLNIFNDDARGDWFTPEESRPETDYWLEGNISLVAEDGSDINLTLDQNNKEFVLIQGSGIDVPISMHWSELEQLGLIDTGRRGERIGVYHREM